ncbi:kinase-like protein [Auricularia subglabra TFB-10046 SS5]|nr:kinase-like protein [Auricularia subglabra TFB-10046 SS5]
MSTTPTSRAGHYGKPASLISSALRVSDVFQDAALMKELSILMSIKHEYILPFVGLAEWLSKPCIVTPWMPNGNVRDYLRSQTSAQDVDRLTIVAEALRFLHTGAGLSDRDCIVHGDVHALNVLIADDGSCRLCDFGLSKLVLDNRYVSLSNLCSGNARHGHAEYMAPELCDRTVPRTPATDVFSFAILSAEVYLGEKALPEVSDLRRGRRPKRDDTIAAYPCDQISALASDCWSHSPARRPTMRRVCDDLRDISSASATSDMAAGATQPQNDCGAPKKTNFVPTLSPLYERTFDGTQVFGTVPSASAVRLGVRLIPAAWRAETTIMVRWS